MSVGYKFRVQTCRHQSVLSRGCWLQTQRKSLANKLTPAQFRTRGQSCSQKETNGKNSKELTFWVWVCSFANSLIFPGVRLGADSQFSDFLDGLGPAQLVGRQTLATPAMGKNHFFLYRKTHISWLTRSFKTA